MNMSKETFEIMSRTGRKVALFRKAVLCECATKEIKIEDLKPVPEKDQFEDLFWQQNQELKSDNSLKTFKNVDMRTYCSKCFGLGAKFVPTITDKIRYTSRTNNGVKPLDGITNESMDFFNKDENLVFFLPNFFKDVNFDDYVCTLKHDKNNNLITPYEITEIFKVGDVTENFENGFLYISVSAEKVSMSELRGVKVIDYVRS